MGRTLSTLIAAACVATVATQAVAAGVMWWHGRLTPAAWEEVKDALDGDPGRTASVPADESADGAPADDEPGPRVPPYEEVLERRATAVLSLADRTEQLRSAARAVAAEAAAVAADRAKFAAERAAFEEELAAAEAALASAATEQTRGLVKTMSPADAVGYLMTLPDLAVVTLLKGLDERTAAKLLAEFAGGTEQEKAKGAAAFAALHAGQPEAAAFDAAAGPPGPSSPGGPGG